MALQNSGPISFNDIHKELGSASGEQCSLGDSDFRGLGEVASGPISLDDFYGKSSAPAELPFYFQFQPEYNVRDKGYLIAGAMSGIQSMPLFLGDTNSITSGSTGAYFTTPVEFILGNTLVEVIMVRATGFAGLAGNSWQFGVRAVTGNNIIPDSGWSYLDFWQSNSATPPTGTPDWTAFRGSPDTYGNYIGWNPQTTYEATGEIIFPYSGAPATIWVWPQAQLAQTYTGPLPPGFSVIFGSEPVVNNNTRIWCRIR